MQQVVCAQKDLTNLVAIVPLLTDYRAPRPSMSLQYQSAFQSSNLIGWLGFIRVGLRLIVRATAHMHI